MAQYTKEEMLSGLKHYDNTDVSYKIIKDTGNGTDAFDSTP